MRMGQNEAGEEIRAQTTSGIGGHVKDYIYSTLRAIGRQRKHFDKEV